MKTKNALAFYCNLKNNYDIVVFDNKKNLTRYVDAYKEIYAKMENEELTFEEFDALANNLTEAMWDNILKTENDFVYKDIKDNQITMFINDEKTKINIIEKLNYGI